MSIGKQSADIEKLKKAGETVKELMDDMNEKELIFFSSTIQNYLNLRLLEKE